MKFNKNNTKKSFTFLGFLTFCAIALSVETSGIKQYTRNDNVFSIPATEQEYENQDKQKTFDLPDTVNEETWEKVKLDKEWEDILGNESGDEVLIAWSGGV